MRELPLTPFGQAIAEEDNLWKEGYDYEQVLAALVWLAHKYGCQAEVIRKGGFTTVQPENKLLAQEINALLNQVLDKRAANVRFVLRFDHVDKAPLVAQELGRPSLRFYDTNDTLFAHSLGSMDSWVKKACTYKDLLPLCGQWVDTYRRLDYHEGWIRLWHRHTTGEVLVLEINEQDERRLWDVSSTTSRAHHRRFWVRNNVDLSFYINEGLIRYGLTRWVHFYGPAYEGVVLNRFGQVPVDLSVLQSSFLQLVYDQLLKGKQSFELKFLAYYLKKRIWIDWVHFYADGCHLIERGYEFDSSFCSALQEWFASAKERFPLPISSIRLVTVANLIPKDNHEFLDLLGEMTPAPTAP